jgi:hypothetical protein
MKVTAVATLVAWMAVAPAAAQAPNGFSTVEAVAEAHPGALLASCGGWEFMDRVVDALRAQDPRWGYNAKRGNMNDPSHDAIAYYVGSGGDGEGSSQVAIFDIIGNHCPVSGRPAPAWIDQTAATAAANAIGRLIACRPGRSNCGVYASGGLPVTPPPPTSDVGAKLNELLAHVQALTATVAALRDLTAGQSATIDTLANRRLTEEWAAQVWNATDPAQPAPVCAVAPWALEGRVFGARVVLRPVQP